MKARNFLAGVIAALAAIALVAPVSAASREAATAEELASIVGGANRECENPTTCTVAVQAQDGCPASWKQCGPCSASINCYAGTCNPNPQVRYCGDPAAVECTESPNPTQCGFANQGTCTVTGTLTGNICGDGQSEWRCNGGPCGNAGGRTANCTVFQCP